MVVIIVGCGKTGRSIAEQLNDEEHDIVVIDKNVEVVESISGSLDVLGVVGHGASYSVLSEAGVENADVLIAVTESDELNLLCCMMAKKSSDCATIARVRNPIYHQEISFIREELGLAMIINPEHAAATEMARILRFPSAINIETFSKGRIEILEFELPESSVITDKSLAEIGRMINCEFLVCAVERNDDLVIPNGNFVLKAGDKINIVATPANSKAFFKSIGRETNQVRNALIVGGGIVAYHLASQLINVGIEVKIIERSLARCEELSRLLPKATIIHADATNQELLIEEDVENCEAFVTLTGIDEGNILMSLFAKYKSKAKVITKINRINYYDIIEKFNLGSIIYPKFITAEYILRYVRALQSGKDNNMITLHKIVDQRAEALEFRVPERSPMAGKAIEEIDLKPNLLIACVNRKGKIIISRGKTVIKAGDSIIVVTRDTNLRNIKDILRRKEG